MRIEEHPILEFERKKKMKFFFNGEEVWGYDNESIAAALFADGYKVFTYSSEKRRPRGAFCMIGKCSSCLMTVNGIPNVRTCKLPVEEGIDVKMQVGKAEFLDIRENFEVKRKKIDTEILVIGGGPAGLCAAISASKYGAKVLLVDEQFILGGQLIKQTHKFFGSTEHFAGVRGIYIADKLKKDIEKYGVEVLLKTTVIGIYEGKKIAAVKEESFGREFYEISAKRIIIATGAMEKTLIFENNDLPGVMGAGGVQTLMNVYGVKPGNRALIVGAGNVGVIVGYQMLQAGMEVVAVVEALPTIGAYQVHASKLRRYGVPIYTRHTILKAHGKEWVEGATIVQINERFSPIEGSEKYVDCDLILIAVGLQPSYKLARMAGCSLKYVPELGGFVVPRKRNLETDVEGIYVCGDVSGIEEASTAMMEGHIAGISAAISLGYGGKEAENEREYWYKALEEFRSGPYSEKVKKGYEKMLIGGE